MLHKALTLALSGALALAVPAMPAHATDETYAARMEAADAARDARDDMIATFGKASLKNKEFVWKKGREKAEVTQVVVSRADQMAYAYSDGELIAASTISSGTAENPTPPGIFPILAKHRHYKSRKYDDAPMPFMQRLDNYGIAMHGGHLPGYPASHGCIRLPHEFAAKLFSTTKAGTPVLIGA